MELHKAAEALWEELGFAKAEEQKYTESIQEKIESKTTTQEENEKARMLADRVNALGDQHNAAHKAWRKAMFGV